jgi:hypothetical protein
MNNFNRSLPRRTFLRGLGATMALPLLDSMTPRVSALTGPPPPIRLGYAIPPTASSAPATKPAPVHVDAEDGRRQLRVQLTMKSLEPFREQINVFCGWRR